MYTAAYNVGTYTQTPYIILGWVVFQFFVYFRTPDSRLDSEETRTVEISPLIFLIFGVITLGQFK